MARSDLPAKHFSMLRGFHLADVFTLANAACGVAGVLMAMRYLVTQQSADLLIAAAFAKGVAKPWDYQPRPSSSTCSTAASPAGAARRGRSAASSIRWPT